MRAEKNIAENGAGLRPSAKAEDVVDASPAVSGALRSKMESIYQVLMIPYMIVKTCRSRGRAVACPKK